MESKKRNYNIDILKTIGLFLIILAHTGITNDFIFQFRNFDVILMVFLSGYLSYNSYKESGYFHYIIKRIKRLLIPTWLFLSIYFGILVFNKYAFKIDFPYTKLQVINSYKLLDGIGFIWIVKVYLLSALIVPFLIKIVNKFRVNTIYIISFIILIINEILGHFNIYNLNFYLNNYLSYIVTYGLITMLGLISYKTNNKNTKYLSALFFIIYLFLLVYYCKSNGTFVTTQIKKYPPMMYYISYGLFISYFLINIKFKNINNLVKKIITFISKSSFWIYLWHIYVIYLVNLLLPNIHYFIKWFLFIIISCLIVYIQNLFVNKMEKLENPYLKRFLPIFRG